jgi:hypothetical protein
MRIFQITMFLSWVVAAVPLLGQATASAPIVPKKAQVSEQPAFHHPPVVQVSPKLVDAGLPQAIQKYLHVDAAAGGADATVFVRLIDEEANLAHLDSEAIGPEGYLIDVTPQRVTVTANTPAGAFYGVIMLCDLVQRDGERWKLPSGRITDWPSLEWRGLHVLFGSRTSIASIETIISDVMPKLRLNQLILEINYNFDYQKRPEVADPDHITLDDAKRLLKLARQNHIKLIPMLNCLGHQSWQEKTFQLLKAYPEFDEAPHRQWGEKGFYCKSWCPSHPDINPIVSDLFDELINAFEADSFHVGMDEVFVIGECERCKGKPLGELYAKAINDYHSHLVGKRGVRMMMWGDRLLDQKTVGYSRWEADDLGMAAAIELIPRDIVICDWHYESDEFPSVPYLIDKGFTLWPTGWRQIPSATKFVETTLQHYGRQLPGYLATTWFPIDTVTQALVQPEPIGDKDIDPIIATIRATSPMIWQGKQ